MNRGAALITATLLVCAATRAGAQDSVEVAAAPPHVLTIDTARAAPFRRSYDMFVYTGDSAVVIGSRDVSLDSSTYAGMPAWLIVESRTGLVPAAESLFVSSAMRPLHWSAVTGLARLGAEFVGDSIYAATSGPTGKQNIIMGGRPDLLASAAMTEVVIGLLPLASGFHDSAAVLDFALTTSAWSEGEISVVGEEEMVEQGAVLPCWVVALRANDRQALYWIDKSSGTTLRVLQMLPPHAGRQLEYRLRDATTPSP